MGRALARVFGLFGGVAGTAQAVDLPPDHAEAMLHVYDGGGVLAAGPAVLIRKSLYDTLSLSATYYVDAVSNASIDVVTTASKYSETRQQLDLGIDYAVRDSLIRVTASSGKEPDYIAQTFGVDVSQELLSGMTTVNLGFTEGHDAVGRKGEEGFFDHAKHWQYRVGATQIVTSRWLASANYEILADKGFLGSAYRPARVFGAFVPEEVPRTRSARALKFRVLGDISDWFKDGSWGAGQRHSMHVDYRYYWDNWAIKAHTVEGGYSRYFGDKWLADTWLRFNHQSAALFYSDNAQEETKYITRNRQLGTFNSWALGGRATYEYAKVPGQYDIKLSGSLEYVRFDYKDFTDFRTGKAYAFNGALLQLYLTANF
ncbi:DUF3570 domain-containing protein [Ideonella sp. DXS29W]|uniref:DUF3570 domain-containing protein n=1 Tax=Ideonella lacteola TaxID=2984193 RepID=A0ABU9BTK6_9BURK